MYNYFGNIVYYSIIFMGFIFSIINLGVQKTTILTIFGASIISIGLASQGILSNFFSGVYISLNEI